MTFIARALILVATGMATACGSNSARAVSNVQSTASSARTCEALKLRTYGDSILPVGWDACTLALRATFAAIADTLAIRALRAQPMAPTAAEFQWISMGELGATSSTKFLDALLRLPDAAYDIDVQFDSTATVVYVSVVHKPLQR